MKKFVKVVCLFLVCSNFCIFSVEKSENANKKTAIRCMDLAESCIYSENFEEAIKNAKDNAKLNNISNVTFKAGLAEEACRIFFIQRFA